MTRASHLASGYKVSPVLNKTTDVPSVRALKSAFFCWQGSFLLLAVIAHTSPREDTNQALFQADNFRLKLSNMSQLNQCLQTFKVFWEISWKELSPVAGKPGGPGCPAGPCGPAGPMGPTLPGSPFTPWHTMKTIVKSVRIFCCILFYIKNSNLSVQVDNMSIKIQREIRQEIKQIEYGIYIIYFFILHGYTMWRIIMSLTFSASLLLKFVGMCNVFSLQNMCRFCSNCSLTRVNGGTNLLLFSVNVPHKLIDSSPVCLSCRVGLWAPCFLRFQVLPLDPFRPAQQIRSTEY